MIPLITYLIIQMRKAKVQKPFIHYEALKSWEIFLAFIYKANQ